MSNPTEIVNMLGGKQHLLKCLESNLAWIKKSFIRNNHKGSSAHRSIMGFWSAPYPETTGYLIETLVQGSAFYPDMELQQLSEKQLDFFADIKNEDGSFSMGDDNYFFDNSQILFGLIELQKLTPNLLIDVYTEGLYYWLLDCINSKGTVVKNNYVPNYCPSYYSRSLWAVLKYEMLNGIPFSQKVRAFLNQILSLQSDNGAFKNWSFDGSASAFSHSIIYTYRGLWESALIINDQSLVEQLIKSVCDINKLIAAHKGLAGSYDQFWNGDYAFICSAGNAQHAALLLEMYKYTMDEGLLDNIPLLLRPLNQSIKLDKASPVPSSIPIWGKYQRFRYTNWTQKFYSDALMSLLRLSTSNE